MLTPSGQIETALGKNPRQLYAHQKEAIKKLDEKNQRAFRGLLVLPTGGGKTLTAVYWLLRTFTAKRQRVLWIAHRHELLNQALATVHNCAYGDVLQGRSDFRYRIISGHPDHDRPVNIEPTDDIIIASKDSLNIGIEHLVDRWLKDTESLLLVVDEAHHATAKTYRKLISRLDDYLTPKNRELRVLGLTATPIRTAENEQGLLKQVFPDDIIYVEHLRKLIAVGILSEPKFENLETPLALKNELTARQIQQVENFDRLPGDIARKIAESSERNNFIVQTYLNNREKYKPVLVFAIDINHAISLNAIFQKYGVASDYIVSKIVDEKTGATISVEQNTEKLQSFRDGELEVLINVQMLTEGTDLPNVQTVFLTRPTTSTILMTQMIGRALRGTKAGGTETAYIVSFIDEWEDKINWVNPEKLISTPIPLSPEENELPDYTSRVTRLISIDKIEEFARMMDTGEVPTLPFLSRIPLGLYSFTIQETNYDADFARDEIIDRHHEALVYSDSAEAYLDFIGSLEYIFSLETLNLGDMSERETLTDSELQFMTKLVLSHYFPNSGQRIGFYVEDIHNILRFYAQKSVPPTFLEFSARSKCNITELAWEIINKDMTLMQQKIYLEAVWNEPDSFWKLLFNYRYEYFRHQVFLEVERLLNGGVDPGSSLDNQQKPTVIGDPVNLQKLTMYKLREHSPTTWHHLREAVFNRQRDAEGYYYCAASEYRSRDRLQFQIDHIKSMKDGGLTEIDNLQLLCRSEHIKKTQAESSRRRRS